MKWNREQPVIISGAGVAGLSCALALAHKGIASIVIETCEKLQEVGAGLQLAPNATRLLERWGVLDELKKLAVTPRYLELKDGVTLKTYMQADLQDIALRRWKSSYITIHRADLQNVLYHAAINSPLIDIQLGTSVVAANKNLNSMVAVETCDIKDKRRDYSTPLLIACDGTWSKMRKITPLNEEATFSGFIAWRATIAINDLSQSYRSTLKDIKTVTAWMGHNNHLIAYPLKAGKYFNFVAITRGENPGETWFKQGDTAKLRNLFHGWNGTILEVFNKVDNWTFWPLFEMLPHRFIANDWLAFVGDSAHGFLPFAAQGAAMAIEDAATLAETLSQDDITIKNALALYEANRKQRVDRVNKRGHFNQFVYHATGPIALGRNLVMKLRSPESFMASLDWLYDYDATVLTKTS